MSATHQIPIPTDLTDQQQLRELAKGLVKFYFKNDYGDPFEMTDGQADIFLVIFLRLGNRTQIIAATQYGKSEIVAMALILRSQSFHENWAIVTGDMKKSLIIMEKVIRHCFDHPDLTQMFELDDSESLDRLRRQRSREYMTWKGGGGVRVFTADARNRQRVKESLTGFGAQNIIEDEASLIPDDLQAMVMRMLGGHPDNFLLKIGNPFYRNHFLRSWQSSDYRKILIDDEQGLKEGRYTPSFLEEMKDQPFYEVLYRCKFPEEDAITDDGWRRLVTDTEVTNSFIPELYINDVRGRGRLGVDIGRGGNKTVFCLRYDNIAKIIDKNRDRDLMSQVGRIKEFMKQYNIAAEDVFIDDVGVGGGVTDRLREDNIMVSPVREGGRSSDPQKYSNIRAEIFWESGQWIKNGGKLVKDDELYQLALINYKEDSSSRLKIEPKADLVKRGVQSPDTADAFSLTFAASDGFDIDDFAIV